MRRRRLVIYASLRPNDPRIRAGVHGHPADTTRAHWSRPSYAQSCMVCYADIPAGRRRIVVPRESAAICRECAARLETKGENDVVQ